MEEKAPKLQSITSMWKELLSEDEFKQMNDELDACEKEYEDTYGTKMRIIEEEFDINEKKNNADIEPVEDPNYPKCDNPFELIEATKEELRKLKNENNDLI